MVTTGNIVDFSWVTPRSEGGLMQPSAEFLLKCKELDRTFRKYNKETRNAGNDYYLKHLVNRANHTNVSLAAKELFFRCKMYFRIRLLNHTIREQTKIRKSFIKLPINSF